MHSPSQPSHIRTTSLCEVWATTAFAADLLGDVVDDFAGFDFTGEVFGDTGEQRDFIRGDDAGEHDDGGAEFVFQTVHGVAQHVDVCAFERGGE